MEPGQYQREGQRVRMKAQLERLQAEISTISRKTGITSAIQLAKLVPKSDTKSSEPDVEWWDALIMTNGHSSQYTIEEVKPVHFTINTFKFLPSKKCNQRRLPKVSSKISHAKAKRKQKSLELNK